MVIERNCSKHCAETEANMSQTLLKHTYRIQWQTIAAWRQVSGLKRGGGGEFLDKLKKYQLLEKKCSKRRTHQSRFL
jgi:hypothetical protein